MSALQDIFPEERALNERIALASPAAGLAMSARVEALAAPVRRVVSAVSEQLDHPERYIEVFAPRVSGLGFTVERVEIRERAARACVAQWLTAYAIGAVDTSATFKDAERWFYGGLPLPTLAPDVTCHLGEVPGANEVFALLPYVLDALRPGTRREVLRNADASADRRARKERGAFYTPADVAAAMTRVLAPSASDTCFDPTCGTGVFLREAILSGAASLGNVHGCDIDGVAVDAAAFVLLATSLSQDAAQALPPWSVWHSARINLATLNTLRLRLSRTHAPGRRCGEVEAARERLAAGEVPPPQLLPSPTESLGSLFPDLWGGADVVLSNPPYASAGVVAHLIDGGTFASPVKPSTRVEALFVEHLWRTSHLGRGRGALVLPLSVAASSRPEFVAMRREMQKQPGKWSFSLFDRAPDALFGDDVKTRNAILTYVADGERGIYTTRLLRWTSRTRRQFLGSVPSTRIDSDIAEGVPKIGSEAEAALYARIRELRGELSSTLREIRPANRQLMDEPGGLKTAVLVAPTGYNWIGVVRDPSRLVADGHTSRNPLLELKFAKPVLADAAYALLSSRVVLWLWHVEGDGFHVTRRFVQHLPFDLDSIREAVPDLAALGHRLWQQASRRPTRSVNAGHVTVAYPTTDLAALDDVDACVLAAFDLDPAAAGVDVRGWHQNLVVVDFGEQKRLSQLARGRESA